MNKADKLLQWFAGKKSAVVALSGGVDSSVVAAAAYQMLGENSLAVTAKSSTLPDSEMNASRMIAKEIGIEHLIIDEDELDDPRFVENPSNRCFFCREGLIKAIRKVADDRAIEFILDGANADDPKEHRPGLQALKEGGARSPLLELGLTKNDVREIARQFKLSISEKPSMACLASRIPYGERITKEKLMLVEKAEKYLKNKGFNQVRVRNHDGTARIEVEKKDIERAVKSRDDIAAELKKIGFRYVTLDLLGYRSGSMDEVLDELNTG